MERDGKNKNISYRPKRLKKFMQTRMKTKKKIQKIQPLTLLYIIFHEKGTRFVYLLSVINGAPSINLVQNFLFLLTAVNALFFFNRNQSQKQPVHGRGFIFLFVPTPLLWRSINPLRFTFYHPRSTDFEKEIEGLRQETHIIIT